MSPNAFTNEREDYDPQPHPMDYAIWKTVVAGAILILLALAALMLLPRSHGVPG